MDARQSPPVIVWFVLGASSWKVARVVSSALVAPLSSSTLPHVPREVSPESAAAIDAAMQRLLIESALSAVVGTLAFALIGAGLLWVMLRNAGVSVSPLRWLGSSVLVIFVLDGARLWAQYAVFTATQSTLVIGLVGLGESLLLAVVMAWMQGHLIRPSNPMLARTWRWAALVGWCIVALLPLTRSIPVAGYWLAWGALLAPGTLPALALWRARDPRGALVPAAAPVPSEDVGAPPEVPSASGPVQ